jgi:AcrR family transcriptional regulator
MAAPPTRTYDSSRRRSTAARTRESVFAAAAELFATRGWAATGMRDIAKAAGVSVETVYSAAGSKRALLLRTIDIAIVGDDEPVPLAARPAFRAVGDGARAERVAAGADLIATRHEHLAPLLRAFAHAAADDDELAKSWREGRVSQRAAFADGLRLLTGSEPPTDVVDALWALGSHDVFLQLTEEAGWSRKKYRTWLAGHIDRLTTPTEEMP